MKIISLSRSPVAGVCILLADYLNKYTGHKCLSACRGSGYGDGRRWRMPDINPESPRAAAEAIQWADVVIAHNGWLPKARMKGKKLIAYYHSEPRQIYQQARLAGAAQYVIAQGHASLYPGLPTIPNIIDIHHPMMQPMDYGERPSACKGLLVGFAPSNKHGRELLKTQPYSPKGWPETEPVIKRLVKAGTITFKLFQGIPYDQCMVMRKACHIFMDDLITGSYHRSTLEACAHRQLVVNGASPENRDRAMAAGGAPTVPWVHAAPETLERVLTELADHPCRTEELAGQSREWMEKWWEPKTLIEKHWLPAIEAAPACG